jgi:hypothetical protein
VWEKSGISLPGGRSDSYRDGMNGDGGMAGIYQGEIDNPKKAIRLNHMVHFPHINKMVLKIPGYCLQTIDIYHRQLPAFSYL